MCGNEDGSGVAVDQSILYDSCIHASNQCSSAACIRDYVRDAFDDRVYKFCPHSKNIMVTAESWNSWAYGLKYKYVPPYNCIAYCTP